MIWRTLAALSLLALGCGDSSGAGADGAGGAGQGGSGAGGNTACPADTLCLDVVAAGDPAPGRLALLWYRVEGAVANDPRVGLELPFDPAAEHVEIPLSGLAPPVDLDLLCERSCEEPASCPCQGAFRAGVAYVIVVTDADQDGALDLEEIADQAGYVGVANVAVVWSATTTPQVPAPFDATFPAGVRQGFDLHRITANSVFEPAPDGARFQLRAGTEAF